MPLGINWAIWTFCTWIATPGGDLERDEMLPDLADATEDAAIGHDLVAGRELADHFAMLLRALGLRPDQQEIEDDEDQHERQDRPERAGGRS